MRLTTKIVTYSLLLLVLLSCKKEYSIKVKVYNPVTQEPYANVHVSIQEQYSNPVGGYNNPTKYKILYEGFTNNNGELLITERFHKDRSYSISCERPDGIEGTCYFNHPGGYAIFKDGKSDKEINFELVPCASLKLKINNVNCQGSSDKMVLFQGNEVGNFDMTEPWQHDGCVNWESNGYSIVPMGEQYYRWEVTKNNVTETYYDTIDLAAGEQRVYEINY